MRTDPVCSRRSSDALAVHDRAGAVDRAVDHPHVEAAPQSPSFEITSNRLHDGGVVELVHVGTCSAAAGGWARTTRGVVGDVAPLHPDERREPDADERDDARHHHQRQLEVFVRLRQALRSRAAAASAGASPARRRFERRLEPGAELVVATNRVRHANLAGTHRSNREHDQRNRHRRRRIVQVRPRSMSVRVVCRMSVRGSASCRALTVERQEHEPEHVGRRQQRRQRADRPTGSSDRSSNVSKRISSLLKKPASSGTPAIASEPIRNVQ